MSDWSFNQKPNTVVYTSKSVVEDRAWIHFVSHDADDGAWQFHSIVGAPKVEADVRAVLLSNIVAVDPTLNQLADLPLGWIAWRETPDGEWNRMAEPRE